MARLDPKTPFVQSGTPSDPDLLLGILSWSGLEDCLVSRAGSPANQAAVRQLLDYTRTNASRWSREELFVELVSVITIALQPASTSTPAPRAAHGSPSRSRRSEHGGPTMN